MPESRVMVYIGDDVSRGGALPEDILCQAHRSLQATKPLVVEVSSLGGVFFKASDTGPCFYIVEASLKGASKDGVERRRFPQEKRLDQSATFSSRFCFVEASIEGDTRRCRKMVSGDVGGNGAQHLGSRARKTCPRNDALFEIWTWCDQIACVTCAANHSFSEVISAASNARVVRWFGPPLISHSPVPLRISVVNDMGETLSEKRVSRCLRGFSALDGAPALKRKCKAVTFGIKDARIVVMWVLLNFTAPHHCVSFVRFTGRDGDTACGG